MLDTVYKILKKDMQCELSKCITCKYSPNLILQKDLLSEAISKNIDWQLTNDPPIISVAAFYGSVRCFNMLIALGADINITDKILFILKMVFIIYS